MKLYLIYILILFLFYSNLCNGFDLRLSLYSKPNCPEESLAASYSSTRCSDLGNIVLDSNNITGAVYSSNGCVSSTPSPNESQYATFNLSEGCTDKQNSGFYYKWELDLNSTPKVKIGACNMIRIFNDSCDYVKIRSFYNGSCFLEKIGFVDSYREYYCENDYYYSFICDKDCKKCDYSLVVETTKSNYDQCTGLDPNSNEYKQYINFYSGYFNSSFKISSSLSIIIFSILLNFL